MIIDDEQTMPRHAASPQRPTAKAKLHIFQIL